MNAVADKWVKCISTEGNIRGVAIQATELVKDMAKLHHLTGKHAQGLGEAVIGSLLIASYCKSGQRVNLNIQGSGYFRQALVDAYPEGHVRGYVIEREAEMANLDDKDELGPWGAGLLSVLRTRDESGQMPYIGTVPLITGHLAKDLSFYWVQSEQVPSAVGLSVALKDGEVSSAVGFLVQAMPGASASEVRTIENHINEMHSLPESIADDGNPLKLLSRIFQSTAFIVVEDKPLSFRCNCSWQRVHRALALVGVKELKSMLAEDHSASVRCDFCMKEYQVSADDLQELIDEAKS